MYHISMDLTRQALKINVKFFSNFGIIFRINYIFLNNCKRGGGGICAEQNAF